MSFIIHVSDVPVILGQNPFESKESVAQKIIKRNRLVFQMIKHTIPAHASDAANIPSATPPLEVSKMTPTAVQTVAALANITPASLDKKHPLEEIRKTMAGAVLNETKPTISDKKHVAQMTRKVQHNLKQEEQHHLLPQAANFVRVTMGENSEKHQVIAEAIGAPLREKQEMTSTHLFELFNIPVYLKGRIDGRDQHHNIVEVKTTTSKNPYIHQKDFTQLQLYLNLFSSPGYIVLLYEEQEKIKYKKSSLMMPDQHWFHTNVIPDLKEFVHYLILKMTQII